MEKFYGKGHFVGDFNSQLKPAEIFIINTLKKEKPGQITA